MASIFFPWLLFYDSYYNTKCKQYYVFDLNKFTHYIIINNGTNSTTLDCDNSPMIFFGQLFFFTLVPMLLYLTWYYVNDHRYGILKLWNRQLTKKLRQKRWFHQIPLIILMMPVNIFMSYIYRVGLPLVIMIPILSWLFGNCAICQRATTSKDNKRTKHIKDRINYHIIPLYLLWMVQETFFFMFIIMFDIIMIITWKNDLNVLYFHFEKDFIIAFFWYLLLISIVYVIHHLQHIRVNYRKFGLIFKHFNQIVPLFCSIWSIVDVLFDILQTFKYKKLAFDGVKNENGQVYTLSPLYFFFSFASLVTPVVLSFILIIRQNQGLTIIRKLIGKEPENLTTKILYLVAEVIIGIPILIFLSFLFCYIVIPGTLMKNGLETVRKGVDRERNIELDPFSIISRTTKCQGILDFYGFGDLKSKDLPLLGGIEQIGEASVQTVITFIFIINHHSDYPELTHFLGLHFETSALSFGLSAVSLLFGFYRFISNIRNKLKT